ncbi:MAG TPA: phospholipase D-like domain-containing protein [Dissulfurispiraceae bacterium]|nr:phospholipase D-like domain-containing protein [Dissulfurispiraceae bacterium]
MNDRIEKLESLLNDAALLRTSGAPLVSGNRLKILRNADENYPEWENAIKSANKSIHIEMYIIHNDMTGRRFRDLLAQKAMDGVKVRVLYDWFGSRSILGSGMWLPLIHAGGEVRPANPPKLSSMLGWVRRDHRKLLSVDGKIAFISGLCIGDAWVGNTKTGLLPWRDTGVMIHGPAVAHAEDAFTDAWRLAGGVIADNELQSQETYSEEGQVSVRVVATSPEISGLYRLDLLIAAAAQDYLWLTDAYFLGTTAYIQALRSAALDGVDVRLLVPHGSDIQWIANLSRTSYSSLLEAGVRVFEWNGPMVHAKTAVCDGRWARVGSTNLNLASWLGNWELDIVMEDEAAAGKITEMFLDDLRNSTEIVLTSRNKVRPLQRRDKIKTKAMHAHGRSVLIRAVTAGSTVNAAVMGRRELTRAEFPNLFGIGLFFIAVSVAAFLLPTYLAYGFAFAIGATGVFLITMAARLKFFKRNIGKRKDESTE